MAHPDPNGIADVRPWQVGDELFNPVTGEYARLVELPWENQQGRARAELLARVGARVMGEHVHPGIVERFTVLDGELTVSVDGMTRVLQAGEMAEVTAGRWHDWWNAMDRDIRVVVEVTPGQRFAHMIETLFGLAQLGYVDDRGMPNLLQMAMTGREFSDVVQFRTPPPVVQKVLFTALAPLAHALGYRGTYPQLSRSVVAPADLSEGGLR
ncbi:MAG: cupin domain-containing protein [Candidatus Nanopelagicales bacterium]|jgi:mannose-6-phosphate isomerase-like protein (cupin superfamily)|nr:cupin domain-containing protein [Candidatus Nanopelagicales bacterium]